MPREYLLHVKYVRTNTNKLQCKHHEQHLSLHLAISVLVHGSECEQYTSNMLNFACIFFH